MNFHNLKCIFKSLMIYIYFEIIMNIYKSLVVLRV